MLAFKVKLEVITPIHIGSGEEYYPVDYTIDESQKKLYVIDENKLLNSVEREGKLDDFTRLASSYTQTNDALLSFIRERAKNNYKYVVDIEDNALNYINKMGAFRAPISRFIRNKYDGKVYIPGSTVKGAIRSALIEMVMKRIDKKYETDNRKDAIEKFKNDFKTDPCRELEAFLNVSGNAKDAKSDVMRYFKISDFIATKTTEKVYKVFAIKRPLEDGTREVQDIPDILESVEKGSSFEGTLEIDDKFLNEINKLLNKFNLKAVKSISANNIALWIRNFYRIKVYGVEKDVFLWDSDAKFFGANEYIKYESIFKKFSKSFRYSIEPKNTFMVKVGKHSGAISKTIDGCRSIWVKGAEKLQDHQTTLWLAGGYPMGWIKGEIKEIN